MQLIVYIIFVVLIMFGFVVFIGAPYVPTRTEDIAKIFHKLKLPKSACIVDMGAGDGKLLLYAAQQGYRVVGYEINPILWLVIQWRLRAYKNTKVYLKSFWRADLSQADMVYTFLASKYMDKLEKKITQEIKPGSWYVSYVFKLNHRKPIKSNLNTYFYQF